MSRKKDMFYVQYTNNHAGRTQIEKFSSKNEAESFARMVQGHLYSFPKRHARHGDQA